MFSKGALVVIKEIKASADKFVWRDCVWGLVVLGHVAFRLHKVDICY